VISTNHTSWMPAGGYPEVSGAGMTIPEDVKMSKGPNFYLSS
jgi:hypothetical protein